jgi:hypothetical protein
MEFSGDFQQDYNPPNPPMDIEYAAILVVKLVHITCYNCSITWFFPVIKK